MTDMILIEVATRMGGKRHYATAGMKLAMGYDASTLCGLVATNVLGPQSSTSPASISIAALPLCKRCKRKAEDA